MDDPLAVWQTAPTGMLSTEIDGLSLSIRRFQAVGHIYFVEKRRPTSAEMPQMLMSGVERTAREAMAAAERAATRCLLSLLT